MTKNFGFGIEQHYYEEQCGMFASNQKLSERLYVRISEEGKEEKSFGVSLSSASHDCGGYGIFDDCRYNSALSSGEVKDDTPKNGATSRLIGLLKEEKVCYDPKKDSLSYGFDGRKEEGGERGLCYGWERICSARHLSDIIKNEMKILIEKNEIGGLEYQI
ncbi:MAG: hypothetical protein WCK90_04885 [archaeon]